MRSLSSTPTTRRGTVLTALGLVVSLLIGFANPAVASSTLTTTGENRLGEVFGTLDGKDISPRAGLIGVDADGDGTTDAWAYCIDLATRLVGGTYTEGSWDAATVPELGRIAWVLHHYPVAPDTPTEAAMAVQAAIWHFSDGFELTIGPGGNSEAVEDLYAFVVAKATTIPEPRPTLSVTPGTQGAGAGDAVVFEVHSTAPGPVMLSLKGAPVDATIRRVRSDGTCDLASPPITELELLDGAAEVCLHAPTAGGPGTLTAVVTQATAIGRVFSKPGSQKLVFAGGGTVTATAEGMATWNERPITTTTSTSTTTPATTSTVAQVPSSTSPPPVRPTPVTSSPSVAAAPGDAQVLEASQPVQGSALPQTGLGVRRPLVLAAGLLLTGFGLVTLGGGRRPS